jgi:exodeoxyribonuclease VII large subunit
MRRQLQEEAAQLRSRRERLQRAHPGARLAQHAQRLDELELRLRRVLEARWRAAALPLGPLAGRLQAAWVRAQTAAKSRLELAIQTLNAYSPLHTLERGFAVISNAQDGTLIRRSAQLRIGEDIAARFSDGTVLARVTGRREP